MDQPLDVSIEDYELSYMEVVDAESNKEQGTGNLDFSQAGNSFYCQDNNEVYVQVHLVYA